jgi:hypothetical protein
MLRMPIRFMAADESSCAFKSNPQPLSSMRRIMFGDESSRRMTA